MDIMKGYIDILKNEKEITTDVFENPKKLLDFISETATKSERQCSGRWIGMVRINGDGTQWLQSAIEDLQRQTNFAELDLGDLLNKIIRDGHHIRVIYIHGHWLNVNSLTDLEQASSFAIGDSYDD